MKFNVLTIFPEMITSYCNESILKRGQAAGAILVRAVNIRDFSNNKHNTVDDSPYGGGAGMVMKPEPIYLALKSLRALSQKSKKAKNNPPKADKKSKRTKKTILLSPRGRQFDQRVAEEWSKLKEITFVCGRYEGVDQRVVDYMVDEEVSVGPYVLAGGELGALVMIEAVARLIPGVLGNPESLREETFNTQPPNHPTTQPHERTHDQVVRWSGGQVNVEYAHYTKPSEFNGWKVPDVLLSGDHKKIEEWRKRNY